MGEHTPYKAAGLVPYCRINDKVHLLFGLEHRGRYEQFMGIAGGKREKSDLSDYDTALREFCEETSFNISENLRDKLAYRDDIPAVYMPECKYKQFFPFLGNLSGVDVFRECTVCKEIDMSSLTHQHNKMLKHLEPLQRPQYEPFDAKLGHSLVQVLPNLSVSNHLLPENWENIVELVKSESTPQEQFIPLGAPPQYDAVRGEILPVPRVIVPTCAHRPQLMPDKNPIVECANLCHAELNIMQDDKFYPPLGLCQSSKGKDSEMGCPIHALELYEFDEHRTDHGTVKYALDFLKQLELELKSTPKQRQEQLNYEWFYFFRRYYNPQQNVKRPRKTVEVTDYSKKMSVPPRTINCVMSTFRAGQWINGDPILAYARVLRTLEFDPNAPTLLEVEKFIYNKEKPEREVVAYTRRFAHDQMLHMMWVPFDQFAQNKSCTLFHGYNEIINTLPRSNRKGKDRYGQVDYYPVNVGAYTYQPARTCKSAAERADIIRKALGLS